MLNIGNETLNTFFIKQLIYLSSQARMILVHQVSLKLDAHLKFN